MRQTPADTPCYLAHDAENIAALICPTEPDCGEDLWRDILAAGAEAALEAIYLAPHENRGRIVRTAYSANIPNPAFRSSSLKLGSTIMNGWCMRPVGNLFYYALTADLNPDHDIRKDTDVFSTSSRCLDGLTG